MRVVLINAVCGKGSTGRICTDIADTLMAQGHDCKILYGNGTSDYPHAVSVSNKWLVKLNALRARITGNDMGGCFISTFRIIRFLKQYKPDVVHLHNVHANFVNFPRLCKFLAAENIATVITLHDCWYFTGKCTYYTANQCYRWISGCGNCPHLKSGIPSIIFDRTKQLLSKKVSSLSSIERLSIIGVSDWITNEVKKSFLKKVGKIVRIYNWIDTSVFHPIDKDETQHQEFNIICVSDGWDGARSARKKEDLKQIVERLPEGMHITLVGDRKNVIAGNSVVKSIGYVSDQSKLAKLYATANVYLHLSREDTFGKVIAESLACGTPAIVYNSTACPEIISEMTGCVVSTGHIQEILDALMSIKDGTNKICRDMCVREVQRKFNYNECILKTIELYRFTLEQ